MKDLFKKLDIDSIVTISEYRSWIDGDEDGVSGGVDAELMHELKCLGINTEKQTVSEISLSDSEKNTIRTEWIQIVGKPDKSMCVQDGWYTYSWEFLFIENDEFKVASGELNWETGLNLQKEDVPFLPHKEIEFCYNKSCAYKEFMATKLWKTIVDISTKNIILFGCLG